ncbi:MAG: exodeoxyribonuclease V alpha subunit, partial [Gammaproteobacteria bacterium]
MRDGMLHGGDRPSLRGRHKPFAKTLGLLEHAGVIRWLDAYLAQTLGNRAGVSDEAVLVALALASNASASGNVCLDLRTLYEPQVSSLLRAAAPAFERPMLPMWRDTLLATILVGDAGDEPFVLDADSRLYLQRFWRYERSVARQILTRAEGDDEVIDNEHLRRALGRAFPASDLVIPNPNPNPNPGSELDPQILAAVLVALRRFVVVTGGPGTGKTTTLARIVAVLAHLYEGRGLRIALVAPTGKGANRAQAALAAALESLAFSPAARAVVPRSALTIHRLLGAQRGERGFRFHAQRQVPFDVLLVDEASMVDLRLMSHLLEAVPAHARVVLFGDADQLASVDAGAVLADLGDSAGPIGGVTLNKAQAATSQTPRDEVAGQGKLPNVLVRLQRRYRFGAVPGLSRLADAIREGNASEVLALLRSQPELSLRSLPDETMGMVSMSGANRFVRSVIMGYRSALVRPRGEAGTPANEAEQGGEFVSGDGQGRFQILTPFREGPYGAAVVNKLVAQGLYGSYSKNGAHRLEDGQPIIIVRNDYDAQLFNGDVGVVVGSGLTAKVQFPSFGNASVSSRMVSVNRLPAWELAYAMTVHKAQGSEFEHVCIALPWRAGAGEPVLT